jgi:hypothetical protein
MFLRMKRTVRLTLLLTLFLAAIGVCVFAWSPHIEGWLGHGSPSGVSAEPAFLTVSSDPPGLAVFANDQLLGKTPLTKVKIPSNETLSVRLESAERGVHWAQTRRASPGEEIKMSPSFAIGTVSNQPTPAP